MLSKYAWKLKDVNGVETQNEWKIIKRMHKCNERSKLCRLYLQYKLYIIGFPEQNKFLDKHSGLVAYIFTV